MSKRTMTDSVLDTTVDTAIRGQFAHCPRPPAKLVCDGWVLTDVTRHT